MIRDDLSVLAAPFFSHVPPRVVLPRVLMNLLVKMNRPRHANNFVARIKMITTKFHRLVDASEGRDRRREPEGLLDSRCKKGEFGRRDELVEMIFEVLTRVLLFPRCDGPVDLISQRLKTFRSLKIQGNQPVPRIRGVPHQSKEKGDKESSDDLRILEFH